MTIKSRSKPRSPRRWSRWDDRLVELNAAHEEASALFALKWRRLAEHVHELDNDRLHDLWDETSDALTAMLKADEVKTKHGLAMLVKWAKIGERLASAKGE
jgi:hypothetical protein